LEKVTEEKTKEKIFHVADRDYNKMSLIVHDVYEIRV
jgi:hypothetical protein